MPVVGVALQDHLGVRGYGAVASADRGSGRLQPGNGDEVAQPFFAEHRLDGLIEKPRPGAQRNETVEQVVIDTLESTPASARLTYAP